MTDQTPPTVHSKIPCGFYDLDAMTGGGFQRGSLVVVANRPSMGGTALALDLVHNVSALEKVPSLIFSPVLTKEEVNHRFLSTVSHIETAYIKADRITETQSEALSRSALWLSQLPIFIYDRPDFTTGFVEQEIEILTAELENTAFVVIDSLPSDSNQSVDEQLVHLKRIAQRLNAVIVVNLPVSREVDNRSDARPRLGDLVDSQVESLADLVIFIYRENYYFSDETSNIAEIIIAKQRNGPTGTIRLKFDPQFATFNNLQPGDYHPSPSKRRKRRGVKHPTAEPLSVQERDPVDGRINRFTFYCCLHLPLFLLVTPQKNQRISPQQESRKILRAVRLSQQRNFKEECRDTPPPPQREERQETVNEPAYLLEWDKSLVDREITGLNVQEVDGAGAFDRILYGANIPRRNDGRVTDATLRRYQHLELGGWWCAGMNLLTGKEDLWGCLKPTVPRENDSCKQIKYEHPLKEPLGIFALRVSPKQFQLVARRHDVQLPIGWETVTDNPWIFWQWVLDNPSIPVVITEGAKKAGTVLSCGYVCVGLPGINSGHRVERDEYGEKIPHSKPTLSPQLQPLAVEGRRFYVAFDQDKKQSTVRTVNRAIATLGKTLENCGCKVNILTWCTALGKGVDDLLFNLYQVNLSNGLDKECAVTEAREFFDDLFKKAVPSDEWETTQLTCLTYQVDLELCQRFLGEVLPPADQQLIAIKSPKNTGKSTWLRWLLLPSILSGERRVLGISHRVQLATQLAASLKLPIITEANLESGRHGYFLCIDSLHEKSQAHFDYKEWDGAIVILDEVQQILWHLLNSSTCQTHRVAIVKTLKNLLNHVIKTGGKLIILDADLSDVAIDFFRGLIDAPISPWIVENTFKPKPWTIYKFSGSTPAAMVKILEGKLQLGEKHMLCVSGQKAKSKWGTLALEESFSRECPGIRILRIDSESIADPDHPAFGCTKILTQVIRNYDLIICSPTIETGVSIEEPDEPIPWFQGVWLIGQGVQTCDSVRQNLARFRPPVDRYIWAKEYGINRVGNGAQTVRGLLAGEFKKDKANIKRLLECGLQEMSSNSFESICINTWAKLGAVINSGMGRYRHTILRDLETEGHKILSAEKIRDEQGELIELPTQDDIDEVKGRVADIRDELYDIHKKEVAQADSLEDKRYDSLSTQAQKRKHERLEYRKGQLERRYLVPVTPEIVGQDDEGWHSQIRLDYYLHEGKTFLPDREKNIIELALKHGEGNYFIVDTNQRLLGNKLACLDQWLGLLELEKLEEIHAEHPQALEIFAKLKGLPREGVTEAQAKGQAYAAQLVLGVSFSKEEKVMCVIQRLYEMIGKRLPFLRREGGRGEQIRIYGKAAPDFLKDDKDKLILGKDGLPVPVLDGRAEVFAAWVLRDELAAQKAAEEKAAAEQQYTVNTPEEEGQAAMVVELAPQVTDQETFDQLTHGLRRAVLVTALRSLSQEIKNQTLRFCKELCSLVGGDLAVVMAG